MAGGRDRCSIWNLYSTRAAKLYCEGEKKELFYHVFRHYMKPAVDTSLNNLRGNRLISTGRRISATDVLVQSVYATTRRPTRFLE
jgi:hypothetical protein